MDRPRRLRRGLPRRYTQTLYALACTSGDAAGCVNRAAGLRNCDYAGDPLRARPLAERQACEARSFAVGCDAADAWGCAMRGQAFANGEGMPADPAAARRDFAAACVKDPKFAACGFARERLAEMKEADRGEGAVRLRPRSPP